MDEHTPTAAEAGLVAGRLREQAARLNAAAAAAGRTSYQARAETGRAGEVTVTVTGTGQVSQIYVGPGAMRSGHDVLAAALCRLVNEAVPGARQRATEAMEDALDPSLRAVVQGAAAPPEEAGRCTARLAGQTVSASSPGGKVTVTADGTGEIRTLKFAATALRGDDNLGLAREVIAAVNGALDGARHLQERLAGSLTENAQGAAAMLEARSGEFGRRMDDLLGQLDQAERRIGEHT